MPSLYSFVYPICACLLALTSLESRAEIYRYIDPQGRMVFTGEPKNGEYIRLIKTPKGWVPENQWLYKRKSSFNDYVRIAAERHRLPYHLVHAVIAVESNYNPEAVSSAGAKGLMQLMPGTAEDLGVRNPFNPAENIDGGSRYLSYLLAQFGGSLELALAAYNAGLNTVREYGNRIPPFPETQNYVKKVIETYKKYRFEAAPS